MSRMTDQQIQQSYMEMTGREPSPEELAEMIRDYRQCEEEDRLAALVSSRLAAQRCRRLPTA